MAYRNWKQEIEDRRREAAPRRRPWAVVAAVVVLAGAACALWGWPGWLRASATDAEPTSAERLYLEDPASQPVDPQQP
ncbi:MAG: hypothetical protein KGY99_10415 [Phycisphaerae bacterium]|nr:hypothetical protein [Phycisphaerae bacterium]